jgi:hypothetical protein
MTAKMLTPTDGSFEVMESVLTWNPAAGYGLRTTENDPEMLS